MFGQVNQGHWRKGLDSRMGDPGRMNQGPAFDAGFRAQLLELFLWRRDVRHFKCDPLEQHVLDRLVETACRAPSVGLSEPWRFVMVADAARRRAIRDCFAECNAEALSAQSADRAGDYARLKLAGLDDAPGHIAVFADRSTVQGHGLGRYTMPETIEYSVVLAIHTLWLAARAEGVGVGWVSILEPSRVAAILDVPIQWIFVGYLCVGYPQEEHDRPALEREGWERRGLPSAAIVRR